MDSSLVNAWQLQDLLQDFPHDFQVMYSLFVLLRRGLAMRPDVELRPALVIFVGQAL